MQQKVKAGCMCSTDVYSVPGKAKVTEPLQSTELFVVPRTICLEIKWGAIVLKVSLLCEAFDIILFFPQRNNAVCTYVYD